MVDFMKKKIIIIVFLFIIIIFRLCYLNFYKNDYYKELLYEKTNNYVYENTHPRGRILDRNGIVLVDNIGIKTLYYTKNKNNTIKDELEIAKTLAEIINIKITSNKDVLKKYWLLVNDNGDNLITEEEKELYKLRKISSDELKEIKYLRIDDNKLKELSDVDKKSATIYDLMNKGYSYEKKLILKGLNDEEYTKIVDMKLEGIKIDISWERKYNYEDTLKDIFGSIGYIPKELEKEYLDKGYNLNDVVGLSYLEYQYEDYLKGEKSLYKVNGNDLELIKEGKNGNDLILSIDINVQLELEKIIKENILRGRNYKHTDYFTESYSIVGNPLTGEIIAMSGQKLIDEDKEIFKNVNTNLINTSYTVGSVVKMATISTGYKYHVIDINTTMRDSCIKLYQVPMKCSYKDLGQVNDITAISKSSNYYQFKIAIGLTNNKYSYNMKLNTTKEHFNMFRETFKEYGLGNITGIDLPNEKTGITGKNTSSDLLLNLSIGQYDTYTPMELFQYINTIANNGKRKEPKLMKLIKNSEEIIYENTYDTKHKVSIDEKYLNRIKEGMSLATISGTARNYINRDYLPAGKTGTSETFIDTNNDGKMDTKTISLAFVGFAPYDNPKYSIIVLTPNIYKSLDTEYNKVYVTRYISQGISNFLFENN